MTDEELVRWFWGKAGQVSEGAGSLHPALFHMLDVGFSAQALVKRNPLAALRGLWLRTPDLPAHIGFLVALHDLGKISPAFQLQREDLTAEARKAGLFPDLGKMKDHGRSTWRHLRESGGESRQQIAAALGAHHGTFQSAADLEVADGQGWHAAREAAIAACGRVFDVDPAECLDGTPLTTAQVMVLAGLTAVADWLGSDRKRFPREGDTPRPLREYALAARERAETAVEEIGWDRWEPKGEPWRFDQLFTFEPNPLQWKAIQMAEQLHGPACIVMEAPMGMGKTEAALFLAEVLLHRAGHAGMYFALPTQATSNPMFRRVRDGYLKKRLATESANLHLLHGLAGFDEAYAELLAQGKPGPEPSDVHGLDGKQSGVTAAEWFRGAKLGLLSPFAVGTIDQALTGVLQTKHPFVRLFGLTNKVVVIDEVHAYDTYTGGVLVRLVEWLAEQRCSVILLSATLPSARRRDLLRAYTGVTPESADAAYPRLTVAPLAERGTAAALPAVPVTAPEMKPATLLRLESNEPWPDGPARLLAEQLAGGGCAAWICNTVDRAQEAYLRLKQDPAFADATLILFHARFPVWRRKQIEKEVLDALGKDVERPRKLVLCASQVAEQSIDIDTDLMVTDLAPMDLLLQRMGRLHRHPERNTERPDRLKEARCYWIGPGPDAGPPTFGEVAGVYDEWHVYRTWRLLHQPLTLTSAEQIEQCVEAAYERAPEPLPGLQRHVQELERKHKAERRKHQGWARINCLDAPDSDTPFRMDLSLPDPESSDPKAFNRAVTRLGDPTVTVLCAEETADPHVVLLADGTPVRLDRKPDLKLQEKLVLHSARLSNWRWVQHFTREAGHIPAWDECPMIRHYRLARFREGVYQPEPGFRLSHSRELGLSIRSGLD